MSCGSSRSMGDAIVRRMVSLPRNILGGVSRVMGQGIDLMGLGTRRRNQHLMHPNFPVQNPQLQQHPFMIQEEWAFLAAFEQQYGTAHPFFYACRLIEALKIAQEEHKFVFMYLHSPDHPFTPSFCRDTLCSEVVVQFIDANFVSWGGLANRGEGLQMATTLQPGSFPLCAVVAPATDDSISVLQQVEGPVSPAELVEILQRTLEEQVLAFGHARPNDENKRREDRRLREEQDAAYLAALQIDQEKARAQKQVESSKKSSHQTLKQNPVNATATKEAQKKDNASRGKDSQVIQILIRFPDGQRKEQSFSSMDKVQAIYRYIDSLGIQGVGNYRLVSSFPRKVYGVDQMGMTLKDAGFHPKASLFLELL
ncbi:hypothetical protein LguiA_009467 [Lonicera macranthoides]